MSEEIIIQDPGELKLWRPPEDILREAQQAAVALQKRIAGKKKPVVFNGEQYIESDDWEMVGHFFGYVAKVESTEFVDFGGVKGFKATAVLLNERTGMVVSRAESMCLNDEENWGPRPKYEWRDVLGADGKPIWDQRQRNGQGGYRKERVEVGEVPTPMFQLLSMAQTRACAKVHRNKLAWVVTLAGYQVTPAEELTTPPIVEAEVLPTEIKKKDGATPPVAQVAPPVTPPAPRPQQTVASHPQPPILDARQGKPPVPYTPTTPPGHYGPPPQRQVRVISEAQARRFYAISKSAGKSAEQVKEYLQHEFGITDDRQIPTDRYEAACKWAEGEDF